MKFRLIYLLFLGALCFVVLPGNKNGRASEAKKGNTGAPGDEANANGAPRICTYCHFGAAGPVVFIHLLDENGDTLNQYIPGQQYKARVTISNNNPSLTGYGFQMIALRDADTTDIDGFFDPGNNTVNNYKIATINNGRTYVEHDNISNSNSFEVVWNAPPVGTGPVSFYAAGNAVNRNGTTSGDGADSEILQVQEAPSAAANDPNQLITELHISPNPVLEFARLDIKLRQSGIYKVRAFDTFGRQVWASTRHFETGMNQADLPVGTWPSGQYFLLISNGEYQRAVKMVKI